LLFAPLLLPYLSELQGQFTFYLLENISAMNSIHAIRLYELLMQWKTTGNREIEIDWLKKQFELKDKYNSIKDLKKYVIDPAVKDINTHSNYQVSWTQRKTGRKVTHLTFEFSEKKPPAPLKKVASKTKSTKKTTQEIQEDKVNNLDYFADMSKRYKGKFNEKSVPQDIVEQLKAQGCW
jgi:plasmid replication initiation protein